MECYGTYYLAGYILVRLSRQLRAQTSKVTSITNAPEINDEANNTSSPKKREKLLTQEINGCHRAHSFLTESVSCFKELESTKSCQRLLLEELFVKF